MIWKIRPSDTFRNDYKILPRHIRILVPDILRSLAENPFEEFLSTHPLREKLQGYHACSIEEDYRIIMRISEDKGEISLLDTGDHSIYKRYV